MIGLIVLGLAFLFFLVVAFFAAKTWHVGHVVAMSFLFLFTLIFLFLTSTLLRTHNKYRPDYAKAVQDIEREAARSRTLQYGDPSTAAGEGSLVGERTLARVESISRGKIWENVRGQVPPDGGPIVLDMTRWTSNGCEKVGQEEELSAEIEPVADEDVSGADEAVAAGGGDEGAVAAEGADVGAVAAGVSNPHGIAKDQFVYAFKAIPIRALSPTEKEYYFGGLGEGEDAFPEQDKKGNCRVPLAYLGKFLVQDSSERSITIVPAAGLTRAQQQQLGINAPWVLYEKLPTDTHALFKGVDPAKLPNLIPIQRLTQTGLPIPPQAYQGMLQEYANDGKELTGRPTSPLRVQVQVEFLQDYEEVVDLVVEGDLPPADQPFNVEGRAQVRSLIQGEPTKFAKGDTATFDGATAGRLVQQGIAKQVGTPTYSRALRNFEFLLSNQQVRLAEVADERRTVSQHVTALTSSLQRLQEQIDKQRIELQLLEADMQGFEAEMEVMSAYRKMLQDRLESLQNEVDTRSFSSVLTSDPIASR